jgi:hypothetical protein
MDSGGRFIPFGLGGRSIAFQNPNYPGQNQN